MPQLFFAPAAPQLEYWIYIHQYTHICPQSALNRIGNVCKSGVPADQVNLGNPPPFNRFPESARKANFQISKKPTPSEKMKADFSFLGFAFFFPSCTYLPHKKKLTQILTNNSVTSSLCCTEEITNHIHRALVISATLETRYLSLNPEPRTDNKTPGVSSTR